MTDQITRLKSALTAFETLLAESDHHITERELVQRELARSIVAAIEALQPGDAQ